MSKKTFSGKLSRRALLSGIALVGSAGSAFALTSDKSPFKATASKISVPESIPQLGPPNVKVGGKMDINYPDDPQTPRDYAIVSFSRIRRIDGHLYGMVSSFDFVEDKIYVDDFTAARKIAADIQEDVNRQKENYAILTEAKSVFEGTEYTMPETEYRRMGDVLSFIDDTCSLYEAAFAALLDEHDEERYETELIRASALKMHLDKEYRYDQPNYGRDMPRDIVRNSSYSENSLQDAYRYGNWP